MADILTTTDIIDPAEQRYFQRVLLWGAYPALCYARFGQKAEIPQGEGDVCMWRRYTALATAKTPLGEGVTPPGKQLAKSDITAQMQQYGDYVLISDKVTVLNKEKVLTVAAKKLSRQFGRTEDELVRDYLAACASSTDAANGSNGDTPTEITAADVDVVVQTLLGNDAQFITEIVSGSAKVGSGPVDASFFGIYRHRSAHGCKKLRRMAEGFGVRGALEGRQGRGRSPGLLPVPGNLEWLLDGQHLEPQRGHLLRHDLRGRGIRHCGPRTEGSRVHRPRLRLGRRRRRAQSAHDLGLEGMARLPDSQRQLHAHPESHKERIRRPPCRETSTLNSVR